MRWMFLALVSIAIGVNAQDHIVTHIGDTIKGKARIMSYDLLDRVQVATADKKKMYTAKDVREIVIEGITYHPIQVDNAIRFMQLAIPGYLRLYYFRIGSSASYDGRYLVKRDGAKMELPNLGFKRALADFLSDDAALSEKIKKGEYSKKNIEQIIAEYNAYVERNTTAQAENRNVVASSNQKLPPIEQLRKNVEGQPEFEGKGDALDLIDDVIAKVKTGQPIPKYLLDGLHKYLDNIAPVKADLDQAMQAVNK